MHCSLGSLQVNGKALLPAMPPPIAVKAATLVGCTICHANPIKESRAADLG